MHQFNQGVCPTFRETATLMNVTIHFVELLDVDTMLGTQDRVVSVLQNHWLNHISMPSTK